MIKVLHFVPALDGGGIERVLYNYYENMDISKIHFDFAIHSTKKGILGNEFAKQKSKIYYVTPKKKNILKYIKDVKTAITSDEYDIIHVHQGFKSWIPLLIGKTLGCKIRIVHSHNYVAKESGYRKAYQYVERNLITSFATNYMACGEKAARWLYGNKILENNKVMILKNAINIDEYIYNESIRKDVRSRLNLENKICIGHVGRFSEQKNHDFLIDIFNEIYKENKDVAMILVGTGEIVNDIKNKVKLLGLEKQVEFLGVRNDVNKIYQAMDLFVFPSLFEGLGIAAVEAQASGIECFVSDVIPKEIELSNNIKFLSLDESAMYWAECILNRLEHIERYDARAELISNGYSIENEAINLVKYYHELYYKLYEENQYEQKEF